MIEMTSNTYKTSLEPITLENSNPVQGELLRNTQSAMGMVPNMYANMVNLPALLQTYQFGYQKFREESGFTPAEQEVVFLTVSVCNDCHYCKAAHGFLAGNHPGFPKEDIANILENKPLSDPKLDQLNRFTRIMCESRGNPDAEQAEAFLEAGYGENHILAIILAISVKIISNYSNHIFHTPIDAVFAGGGK